MVNSEMSFTHTIGQDEDQEEKMLLLLVARVQRT